jgi:hypothetical protein
VILSGPKFAVAVGKLSFVRVSLSNSVAMLSRLRCAASEPQVRGLNQYFTDRVKASSLGKQADRQKISTQHRPRGPSVRTTFVPAPRSQFTPDGEQLLAARPSLPRDLEVCPLRVLATPPFTP